MALCTLVCLSPTATGEDVAVHALVPLGIWGAGNWSDAKISPDGRLLAVITSRGFELRDTAAGRLLNSVVRTDPPVGGLCWSPDGKRLGILGRTIEIWNPMGSSPERQVATGSVNEEVYSIELGWSPDRRRIALALGLDIVLYDLTLDRRIPLLGGRTEEEQRRYPQQGFSWSPGGGELAVLAGRLEGESIDIWNVGTMAVTRSIPVGKLEAKGGRFGLAGDKPWRSQIEPGLGYPTQTSRVAWSPDGQVLAVTSVFTGLSLWDTHTGRLLIRAPQTEQAISLSWASDSQTLYVGSNDHMWNLRRDDAEPVFTIARGAHSCDVSRDGRLAAAVGFEGDHLSLWHGREAAPSVSLSREALPRGPLTLSPDMRKIAAPSGVWDLKSGKKLADFGPGGLVGF